MLHDQTTINSAAQAWEDMVNEHGTSLLFLTAKEIFDRGYYSGYYSRDGEWEDGYAHGYDEGRYKTIEEGC
jgi:hypothetical protein